MLKTKHVAAYPKRYATFFLSSKVRSGHCTLRKFENWIKGMTSAKGIQFKSVDDCSKFKGDALEVLAELFYTINKADPRVGLVDYSPIPLDEDYGVDATGTNVNGDKVAVQVKYRGNPHDKATYPTYAEIARTFASGVCQCGIDPSKDSTIFVLTNADRLGSNCQRVLGNRLVATTRQTLKHFMDNNRTFWRTAAYAVLEYLQRHSKDKVIQKGVYK